MKSLYTLMGWFFKNLDFEVNLKSAMETPCGIEAQNLKPLRGCLDGLDIVEALAVRHLVVSCENKTFEIIYCLTKTSSAIPGTC